MTKKVIILLSSYNGADHIREQIESILSQTYKDISLYVRDDGSTDGTVDILNEYEKEGKLILYKGKNVGFIKSFLWLVRHAKKADYYAYADQDDVWLPEKISMAVKRLDEESPDKPLLYFSNYNLCDDDLNFIKTCDEEGLIKKPSFANALVDCMPLGFNAVFNYKAKELIAKDTPKYSCGHDWWTYILCQGLGKVIYDNRPTVNYRRTGHNVSPGGMSFIKFQIWRFKKFFINDYFSNCRKMLREFEYYYKDDLSENDKKVLALFTHKRYNFMAMIKKLFYPHRFRQGLFDELAVRFLFIIGKL
ncbi:MAG: glycosyltransferase family 2 protein [Lachnospiraceae bacterium]|nr:glycosyltransferase family 2 protein [Lachnospiraceae bacterium]